MRRPLPRFLLSLSLVLLATSCGSIGPCPVCAPCGRDVSVGGRDLPGGSDTYAPPDLGRGDAGPLPDTDSPFPIVAGAGWPTPNAYSWDGSWRPRPEDFPLDGLFDDEYGDGHTLPMGGWEGPTPRLPPGDWDWNDANDDFANYRNFHANVGIFAALLDGESQHFGWRLAPNEPEGADYGIQGEFFHGTPGVDVLHLGAAGAIHTFTTGQLGEGPDVLVFDEAWSLDFFLGARGQGSEHDNDLVVAGCRNRADGSLGIRGASIHTGPGRDWIFVRNAGGAAFDAGNLDGRTDQLDPDDGDDLIVLRGNMTDFRVFGGGGDDTFVWYMDDSRLGSIAFQGPNIFGGGGSGAAVWDTEGTDRLVLVIPPDTRILPFGDNPPGTLTVGLYYGDDGTVWWDEPMYGDPLAEYCITCGRGPSGERTITLAYHSASGHFETGWFWITDIEEIQLGLGAAAALYRVDQRQGSLSPAPDLSAFNPPAEPLEYCRPW